MIYEWMIHYCLYCILQPLLKALLFLAWCKNPLIVLWRQAWAWSVNIIFPITQGSKRRSPPSPRTSPEEKTSSVCLTKKTWAKNVEESTNPVLVKDELLIFTYHLPKIQIGFVSYLDDFFAFIFALFHVLRVIHTRNTQIQIMPFNVTTGEPCFFRICRDFLTFFLLDETVKVFADGNSLTNLKHTIPCNIQTYLDPLKK